METVPLETQTSKPGSGVMGGEKRSRGKRERNGVFVHELGEKEV